MFFGASYLAVSAIHSTSDWKRVFSNGTYVGMIPNDDEVVASVQRLAVGYHVDVRMEDVHTSVPSTYDWQMAAGLPVTAVAVMYNGKPVVYTADDASATQVLQRVQQALAPTGVAADDVQFAGKVALQPTVVSVANVMSPDSAVRYILHPSRTTLVGRGISLRMIADGADASRAVSPPSTAEAPLMAVEADVTVSREVAVPYTIQYVKSNQLAAGTVKVQRHGQPGKKREQVEVRYVNGKPVGQKVVQQTVLQSPQPEVALLGINNGVASGSWQWPSPYTDITSPFGYRSLDGGEMHPGVDIGCPIGTPVYASNNGVVEEAGWNSGGYGNWIKINNGNGIETVYGHLSRPVVHAGQTVSKGQLIGYSGDTGHVTGPHLHYEVRINGRPVEPTPYM